MRRFLSDVAQNTVYKEVASAARQVLLVVCVGAALITLSIVLRAWLLSATLSVSFAIISYDTLGWYLHIRKI